jgi:hypothetical protein
MGEGVKPHIFRKNGKWWCCANFGKGGTCYTPKTAFMMWVIVNGLASPRG